MFRAILFDLDNTLIDFMSFKKETAKAAAKAMVKQGLPASETNKNCCYSNINKTLIVV